jgi:hypothetical protein
VARSFDRFLLERRQPACLSPPYSVAISYVCRVHRGHKDETGQTDESAGQQGAA